MFLDSGSFAQNPSVIGKESTTSTATADKENTGNESQSQSGSPQDPSPETQATAGATSTSSATTATATAAASASAKPGDEKEGGAGNQTLVKEEEQSPSDIRLWLLEHSPTGLMDTPRTQNVGAASFILLFASCLELSSRAVVNIHIPRSQLYMTPAS